MKLRNLMYATMIACAFASCSNDDVIENGPDAKGDASLTIDLGVKSTKADIAAGTETAFGGSEASAWPLEWSLRI